MHWLSRARVDFPFIACFHLFLTLCTALCTCVPHTGPHFFLLPLKFPKAAILVHDHTCEVSCQMRADCAVICRDIETMYIRMHQVHSYVYSMAAYSCRLSTNHLAVYMILNERHSWYYVFTFPHCVVPLHEHAPLGKYHGWVVKLLILVSFHRTERVWTSLTARTGGYL